MRAQQQALAQRLALLPFDYQRVLRVARGMVGREVERLEVVVIGLDLGPFGDRVSHPLEDFDDLIHRPYERMLNAKLAPVSGQGDIEAFLLQTRS